MAPVSVPQAYGVALTSAIGICPIMPSGLWMALIGGVAYWPLIVEGLSNKQIGHQLRISYRTVEDHRLEIYKKLGVHNGIQLMRRVMVTGRTA